MAIRLSGLNSGLDTDSIVSALVSAYNFKKDKYVKAQTKLSWTQDAWKALNTKVYSLYTNISNLRFSAAYNLKKTTSSDTTKATVTASNSAVNGSQKLNVLQLAQSGYMTGGKLDKGIKASSTLAELGYTGGTAAINVDRGDGTSSTIEVKSTSTISDVVNQLKDAGLNASFDTTNNRLFISSKASGKDTDFNLIGANANGLVVLEKLGLSTSLTTTDKEGNTTMTAAGEAYQKYAQYAAYKTEGGNEVFDEVQTRKNIEDAIAAYSSASEANNSASEQLANLTSALAYATSYSNAQDFYAKYGIEEADQARFNSVMMNSASGGSLVDTDGNVYKAISGKDDEGNTVYRHTDADGKQTLVSREVTYTLDGKTYKKNDKGKYATDDGEEFTGDTTQLVKDENMHVNYYKVEENILYKSPAKKGQESQTFNDKDLMPVKYVDGETGEEKEHYVITIGDKTYVSEKIDGKFVNQDDPKDTLKLTKSYTYEKKNSTSGLATVSEAYNSYKDVVMQEEGMDEDAAKKELTSITADVKRVNTFETSAKKEAEAAEKAGEDVDPDYYSKSNIVDQIHDAYEAGKLDASTTGAEAVDALIQSYTTKIADFKTAVNDAQDVMDANKASASLAGIEDADEQKQAIDNFLTTVQSAVSALANPTAGAAVKVDGQDAIIKLNGVEYTNSSNNIQVNGLTINAQGVTGDGDENAITITTSTDTQGIYDKIKDFLTEYNNIINEMTKLYNAASSKGYDPLTDDEKESMSDSEIDKWETKIKDSLFRNDSTLNGIISTMTSAMSRSFEINGKKYSLSSFGISTLGYLNAAENEYNAYHIDGDEDDTNTSGKKDKLMAAIESDPDTVMAFFQNLTTNLYNSLGNKMKSTSLSSSYTIYNDKQYDKQYKEYSKLISEWEERISAKEEYYYKKFSAMESALAKLNSTQSSLSGYFG